MVLKILTTWFLIIFIVLIPINYRSLMAIKFSSIFQRSSTWQIKFLITILSIIMAFFVAFAFVYIIERIKLVIY